MTNEPAAPGGGGEVFPLTSANLIVQEAEQEDRTRGKNLVVGPILGHPPHHLGHVLGQGKECVGRREEDGNEKAGKGGATVSTGQTHTCIMYHGF